MGPFWVIPGQRSDVGPSNLHHCLENVVFHGKIMIGMLKCGKESWEGAYPGFWPVNHLWVFCVEFCVVICVVFCVVCGVLCG